MIYEVERTLKVWMTTLFLLFLLINRANTDLPVHCLAKDIKGEWLLIKSTDLKDNQ